MDREEHMGAGTGGDDVRTLLGAWALDAVDDVERAAVERAIRADPALAEEAQGLRETAADLAWAHPAAPPAQLRDAVLGRISDAPSDSTATQGREAPRRQHRAARWIAAAAAALLVAIPSALAVREWQRATRAEAQLEAIEEALTTPGAELVASDLDGGGRAVAVIAASEALFTAVDLPDPGDDRTYQLWLVTASDARSAGVLEVVDGTVTTTATDVAPGDALAVTIEPAGGSDAPTTDPLVVLAPPG